MKRIIVTTGWLLLYILTPWGVQAQTDTVGWWVLSCCEERHYETRQAAIAWMYSSDCIVSACPDSLWPHVIPTHRPVRDTCVGPDVPPAPTSVLVWEIDTVHLGEVAWIDSTGGHYVADSIRVDSIPRWIAWPPTLTLDPSIWGCRFPIRIKPGTVARLDGDTIYVERPWVDTVIVVDTVCPCDHEWEYEYRDIHDQYVVETVWLFDEMMRQAGFYKTGNSRCIYCGTERRRK